MMKHKQLTFLQHFLSILVIVNFTGCTTLPVPSDAMQAASTPAVSLDGQSLPSLPLAGTMESTNVEETAPLSGNPLLLNDQELEPITGENIQQLSILARFSEGGLGDEFALSPDGKFLAIAAEGGVILYDALTGERLDFYSTGSNVIGLAFSPDSQTLAYFSRIPSGEKYSTAAPNFAGEEILKPALTLRSVLEGEVLYSRPMFGSGCGEYSARELTFSSDGKLILFQDHFGYTGLPSTGSLCIVDTQNGDLLRSITLEKPWRVESFTPPLSDEKTVWTICEDDSKVVEAGLIYRQLRKYNLENGALEAQVELSEPNQTLRLSPDRQWMFMGKQIRSTQDGSLVTEIENNSDAIEENLNRSVADYSADSSMLAVGDRNGSVSLYNVPTGQFVSKLEAIDIATTLAKNEQLNVVDLRFSVDGSILYILLNSYFVDTPEVLRAVRLADGQELFRLSGRNTVDRRPSLSADHTLLAWGGYEDGSVQVWSVADGNLQAVLRGHSGTVLQTLFSPDGRQLASASMDGTVRLWHVGDGVPAFILNTHQGAVWSVAYSKDGSRLASIGKDGMLNLWNPLDGSLLKTWPSGTEAWQVNSIAFTNDNRAIWIASGCIYVLNCMAGGSGDLRSLDLETGQISILYGKGILDSSLSADQTIVGLFGVEGAQIGRISSGQYQTQQTFTSPFGNGGVYGAAISPDGSLFISGNFYGVHVWEPNSGQLIALAQDRSRRTGNYGTMQLTSDMRHLIVAGADGVIYMWGVKK